MNRTGLTKGRLRFLKSVVFWLLGLASGHTETVSDFLPERKAGWGVDALLSSAISTDSIGAYTDLIGGQSQILWVRERGTGANDPDGRGIRVNEAYAKVRGAGFHLVSFAQDIRQASEAGSGFAPNCRAVFEEGIRLGRDFAGSVSAWELHNEPELAWWHDMPDRYISHAKALYLGLKRGSRSLGTDTPVLLGALGLPAGPWLERSARNGLLDYGDAWNVHYYGDDSQFTGFLNGHVHAMEDLLSTSGLEPSRLAARQWPVRPSSYLATSGLATRAAVGRVLPIWATEVGVNTVTPDTWADPVRRRRQADWVLSTAKQALAHPQVAVFMPFVLVHKGDGYALTESATETWPAWDEYARFTREHPFPSRLAVRPPSSVNPLVLQWLADAETASGHKLAAAYRWRADGKPIRGELRIYNFGDEAVLGHLRQTREPGDGGWGVATAVPAVRSQNQRPSPTWLHDASQLITVPAGGMLSLPLRFELEDAPLGGGREWRQFSFVEKSGRRSVLGFALERSPDLFPPAASPLGLAEWGQAKANFQYVPHAVPGVGKGTWQAINGVKVLYAQEGLARFELGERPFDQEYPPMVAAYLPEGLPESGWLRVAMRELGPAGVRMRVDLVDGEGRRFTQWENLGQVRGLSATAPRWLNLLDFHPYGWGKLDKQRRLRPAEVREVQLRFFASKGPTLVDVELGFAREYGDRLDLAGEIPVEAKEAKVSAPVE